eukprot:6400309-Prorocentrum_lima.AAC.1
MTSSLVGSEMCIRDRATHVEEQAHIENIIVKKDSPHSLNFKVKYKPVSYTHLTLPTICSV